jgi:hypothetical protein
VFVPVVLVDVPLIEVGCVVVSVDVASDTANKPIAIVNTKLIIKTFNFISAS